MRVAEHKRAVAKFRKENGSLQHEFEKARSAAKQSRARLAQTENELAIVRKRLQLAQSRPGTPADDGSSRTGRAGLADRAFLFSRTRISVKQEVSAPGSRNRPRSRSPAMGSGRSGRPPSSSARPRSATTVVPLCRDEGLQSLTAVCSAGRLVVARRAPQRSFSLSKRLTRNLTPHFFLSFRSAPSRRRSGGSGSERERPRYRSPSPGQARRGASPSLTRPTSADKRRREEISRREREREREAEKRNRIAR